MNPKKELLWSLRVYIYICTVVEWAQNPILISQTPIFLVWDVSGLGCGVRRGFR